MGNTLNKKSLANLKIPLPPLSEQRRIAAILDKADALRRKRKRALDLLDGLTQSIFLEMFGDPSRNTKGWATEPFGELCLNENAKRVPIKSADRDAIDGPYPYYGASGVIDYIDDYRFDGPRLLIAEDGANLISRSTPIAFLANGKYWVNNHAHVVAASDKSTLIFLQYFFSLTDLKPHVTGSAQPKLNRANLDKIPVINPPIELQNAFDKADEEVQVLRERMLRSLRLANETFSTIQYRAFSGQL